MAEITEVTLHHLCQDHYAQTRRFATVVAVPVGTLKQLEGRLPTAFTGNKRMVLYTVGTVVSLEELRFVDAPTVLADRAPLKP